MPTRHNIDIFNQDFNWLKFSSSQEIKCYKRLDDKLVKTTSVFVFTKLTDIPRISDFIKLINKQNKLSGLLIRADVPADNLPQIYTDASLRALKHSLVYTDDLSEIPRRVVNAWKNDIQDKLIAKAIAHNDMLYVVDCEFNTYSISFDDIPSLRKIPKNERKVLKVSDDGGYVNWPSTDTDIDLDIIKMFTNKNYREEQERLRLESNSRFGDAVKTLRLQTGLRQTDFKDISDRQIRRIESGDRPSYSTIVKLANQHGITVKEYLNKISEILAN